MIVEVAHIVVLPGTAEAFEAGVAQAVPLFQQAQGCSSLSLERVLEHPNHYHLVVAWDTLEDHTVTFRGSAAFQAWRNHVGSFFAQPPAVVHLSKVLHGF